MSDDRQQMLQERWDAFSKRYEIETYSTRIIEQDNDWILFVEVKAGYIESAFKSVDLMPLANYDLTLVEEPKLEGNLFKFKVREEAQ